MSEELTSLQVQARRRRSSGHSQLDCQVIRFQVVEESAIGAKLSGIGELPA